MPHNCFPAKISDDAWLPVLTELSTNIKSRSHYFPRYINNGFGEPDKDLLKDETIRSTLNICGWHWERRQ
ncbi:hypothetical protein ACHWQZ_G016745 [Mnemiopsis leidyi]